MCTKSNLQVKFAAVDSSCFSQGIVTLLSLHRNQPSSSKSGQAPFTSSCTAAAFKYSFSRGSNFISTGKALSTSSADPTPLPCVLRSLLLYRRGSNLSSDTTIPKSKGHVQFPRMCLQPRLEISSLRACNIVLSAGLN